MKIVVTGCNGRLGQTVCEVLLASGHVVAGIDRAAAGERPHPFVIDTLLNPFAIHRVFDLLAGQVEAVVHLANHVNAMAAPAEQVLRENLAMNTSVFVAAAQAGATRAVFASSVQAMLGGHEADGSANVRMPHALPVSEKIECRPTNAYGLSKVLTETMLDHLCDPKRFGQTLSAVSLRFPYILAPQGLEATVTRTAPLDFIWGGSEAFSYIAREDAAEAIRLALEAPIAGHRALWCAAPDPRTSEPVSSLVERFYSAVPGADEALRRDSLVDCDAAAAAIGWRATRVAREERSRRGPSAPAHA